MKYAVRFMLFLIVAQVLSGGYCIVFAEAAESNGKESAYSQKRVPETFLDTLNSGKEISLVVDSSAAAVTDKKDTLPQGKKAYPEGFRIQLLASSSIEAVRAKKRTIEDELKLKVYVDFDAPYYKVYVGDYKDRKEADAALLKIKQSVYPDAWIVKSQVFVDE